MSSRDELQQRIDAALRETPEQFAATVTTDYEDPVADLTRRFYHRAMSLDDAAAVEAALEEFESMQESEGRRARRALAQFVTHHPAPARLGLRVPDLEARSPWLFRRKR